MDLLYKMPIGSHQEIGYDINNDEIHVYKTVGYEQCVFVNRSQLW